MSKFDLALLLKRVNFYIPHKTPLNQKQIFHLDEKNLIKWDTGICQLFYRSAVKID